MLGFAGCLVSERRSLLFRLGHVFANKRSAYRTPIDETAGMLLLWLEESTTTMIDEETGAVWAFEWEYNLGDRQVGYNRHYIHSTHAANAQRSISFIRVGTARWTTFVNHINST